MAIKRYHVFTDGKDEWFGDFVEAKEWYEDWCEEYDNVRLYEEVYADDGALVNDEMDNEDCLLSQGNYPL